MPCCKRKTAEPSTQRHGSSSHLRAAVTARTLSSLSLCCPLDVSAEAVSAEGDSSTEKWKRGKLPDSGRFSKPSSQSSHLLSPRASRHLCSLHGDTLLQLWRDNEGDCVLRRPAQQFLNVEKKIKHITQGPRRRCFQSCQHNQQLWKDLKKCPASSCASVL